MNTKIRSIAIIVIILLLIAALFISIVTKRPVELESGYRLVMGTFARVVVVAKDAGTAQKCIEVAFTEIDNVDKLMSDYKNDSEISIVNKNAATKAVQVGKSTFEVLQRSVEFSKLTDGAFDITVGPLVDLFRVAKESQISPTLEQIEKTKSKVGYEKLILDPTNKTVQFAIEGMRLDLGGIAKGYGIDKAIEAMQKAGALGAMVDIGGDVRCFGDYQQFVIIDGKQYSHIIDRRIGTSTDGLSSVTIITDNATDADALATAVSIMGGEFGLALIEKLPETEAILIPFGQKEFITSNGAEKYIE